MDFYKDESELIYDIGTVPSVIPESTPDHVLWMVTKEYRDAAIKKAQQERKGISAGMRVNLGLPPSASQEELIEKLKMMEAM